jgi:uncharacterized SAM-dependent methyltransferase
MTTTPISPAKIHISDKIASAVYEGLMSRPKWLPSWLFYDAAGSKLFDEITRIPEYYVTRTERKILAEHCAEIVSRAAGENPLRIVELGAGSADKTRLLLVAAADRQETAIAVKSMKAALRMRGFQYRYGYLNYDEDIFRGYVEAQQNEYLLDSAEGARGLFVDALEQFERLTGIRTIRVAESIR